MKSYQKYYAVVISITSIIVYFLLRTISNMETNSEVILFIISGLSAFGTYKAVIKIVELVLNSNCYIKSFILGKYYLDGIWIGAYRSSDGNPIYYIEHYYQSFEKIIVKGRCYFDTFEYKGSWDSEIIYIDTDKDKITYNYYTNMNKNNHINLGQATFDIIREADGKKSNKANWIF